MCINSVSMVSGNKLTVLYLPKVLAVYFIFQKLFKCHVRIHCIFVFYFLMIDILVQNVKSYRAG